MTHWPGQNRSGFRFRPATMIAVILGGAIALPSFDRGFAHAADLSVQLEDLRAHYNSAIVDLNLIQDPPFDPEDYDSVDLHHLIERYSLGPVELEASPDGLSSRHLGTRVSSRGALIARDPEESYEKAAPRTYRLYKLVPAEHPTQMLAVALDVSALPTKVQSFVDETCGSPFACDAAVYGRIGEIEAERETNAFVPTGPVTMMIGVIAERIEFFGITQ